MTLCSTHGISNMDMELFDLTNVINAIEINHLNITNCDCNVIVNDVTIILFKKLSIIIILKVHLKFFFSFLFKIFFLGLA
jgi:hypothetical protein